jgi:hypothetical protein
MNECFLISPLSGENDQRRLQRLKMGVLGVLDKGDFEGCLIEIKQSKTLKFKLMALRRLYGHPCFPELLENVIKVVSEHFGLVAEEMEIFQSDLELTANDYIGAKLALKEIDALVDSLLEDSVGKSCGIQSSYERWFDRDRFSFLYQTAQ